MFGTEDLVFVPEDSQLIIDDVQNWRRIKIDVRRLGLRIRATAFDAIVDRVRGAVRLMENSERHRTTLAQMKSHADTVLHDLAALSGGGEVAYTGDLRTETRSPHTTWWIRVSDRPAESYFPEDYERSIGPSAGDFTGFQTFGSVQLEELHGLEVSLAGDDEDGMPFTIEVVKGDGLTRWTMPVAEPLGLVREFCGVHGVSAHGRTVNIDARGDVAASHQFCTPLGKIGEALYVTLYMHYTTEAGPAVMGKVPDARILDVAATLERSHFALVHEGPTHRIYAREGDVVHLYCGLAGRESEGNATIPSLIVVAMAGGSHDPEARADLFESIRDSVRQ